MDWFVDASRPEAVHVLRREVVAHLTRHAMPEADLSSAELAVGELLGNLSRHAPGPAWVSLNWPGETVALSVTDLGPGYVPSQRTDDDDLFAESGRGFLILEALTEDLHARARASGGSRVTAQIPLPRRTEQSHSPTPSTQHPLPDLAEARPEGGFGKESFLRALVVQLAQAVEHISGPTDAEHAVAQVGTDVGGQMEAEYRLAAGVVGRLSPEQIAECLTRLKKAIDGSFRVSEVTEHRIVFTNTACPFGDVVQRAPALCRMTSSVFGGIAARNSADGRASVLLEERVAVGDAHCKVVVYLGAAPAEVAPYAHRYVTAEAATAAASSDS
jgi:anti-sigma regulatory factor (Ser/Thr protein kinase)